MSRQRPIQRRALCALQRSGNPMNKVVVWYQKSGRLFLGSVFLAYIGTVRRARLQARLVGASSFHVARCNDQ